MKEVVGEMHKGYGAGYRGGGGGEEVRDWRDPLFWAEEATFVKREEGDFAQVGAPFSD